MQQRYRIFKRASGIYYAEDTTTHRQETLRTKDKAEALALAAARNQAREMPALNLAMARTYLMARSPDLMNRTWANVIDDLKTGYNGETQSRWERFARSAPMRALARIRLAETEPSDILHTLRHPEAGTSTNVWLRRLHNYALDMGWLLSPALSRKAWPKIRYGKRTGITAKEHERIIASELNAERRNFYEMLWETGGAQSDIANLRRENVDVEEGILMFYRQKLEGRESVPAQLRIGENLARLLAFLPTKGALFPRIAVEAAKHRSTEFKRRCRIASVEGRTLHCYRYAWAERACAAGMPEREAMAHLGHKSPAVHRAYAKKARNVTMPLEFYEQERRNKLVAFQAV